MDKTQAVIQYLINECPMIKESPLYFNFINAQDEDKQFVTTSNEKTLHKPYIDGSVMKRFTFTIIDYRSVAYQEMSKQNVVVNESVEEYLDVQALITWVNSEEDTKNYLLPSNPLDPTSAPKLDFGEDCVIDHLGTASENPNLNGVDTQSNPALAKYSISIQIDYLDKSKMIWKN